MSVFTVRAIFNSLGNTGFKVFFKQQLWNTIYCPTESKINSIIQSIVQSRVQVLYLPMKKASFILLVSSFLRLVSNLGWSAGTSWLENLPMEELPVLKPFWVQLETSTPSTPGPCLAGRGASSKKGFLLPARMNFCRPGEKFLALALPIS